MLEIMQKIGIYGGSFNPPHVAHLVMAENFREQAALDKVIFIPAYVSPFKAGKSADMADSADRLKMARLATESNPRFEVEDYEIRKEGISFTVNTLEYLQSRFEAEFYLLIGADQAVSFTKWKQWEKIIHLAKLSIVWRPGFPDDEIEEIDKTLKKPLRIKAPLMDISSSDIRERIREGKSIRYIVPDAVAGYIEKMRLYR